MTSAGSSGGGGQIAPWVIPGCLGGLLVADASLWVAGGIVSFVRGEGWVSAPFSITLAIQAAKDGTATFWQGVAPTEVWSVAAVLLVAALTVAAVPVVRWWSRRPGPEDPLRSLARMQEVRHMTANGRRLQIRDLRPSLAGRDHRDIPETEAGIALGMLKGTSSKKACLYASFEDSFVAIMAPRSGKTTAFAVPQILKAPGAVVATSNKVDLLAATSRLRAESTGERVWVFDPQHIAHATQTWWWDPLEGLQTVEDAERLAGHFVLTVDDEKAKDIWGPAAKSLLGALIMAAAVSDRSILDVYEWVNDEVSPEAVNILREHGYRAMADSLAGTQGLPGETKGGVFFTAREATACLRNPDITNWVTPPQDHVDTVSGEVTAADLEVFDPWSFAASRQTLFLLSKDGGGSAGPLVAALTDRVMRCAVALGEEAGGRLDPPMLAVLDEAANVCRIADLPDLYSHLGSRGIVPWTILQSYAQGGRVWGEAGMKTLWGAATIKIIGSGMDDASFASDLSRLVGEHDVKTVSRTYNDGSSSRSVSTRRESILPVNKIRSLPKNTVLLFATGITPALLTSLPWYQESTADQIKAEIASSTKTTTAAARERAMRRRAERDARRSQKGVRT
ncbi:hypothetical protein NUM3379_35300 [Kineococcus sp. NUM-3379]